MALTTDGEALALSGLGTSGRPGGTRLVAVTGRRNLSNDRDDRGLLVVSSFHLASFASAFSRRRVPYVIASIRSDGRDDISCTLLKITRIIPARLVIARVQSLARNCESYSLIASELREELDRRGRDAGITVV